MKSLISIGGPLVAERVTGLHAMTIRTVYGAAKEDIYANSHCT